MGPGSAKKRPGSPFKTYFYTYEGTVRALEEVSFHIDRGEIFGLVGETGCGKRVTARSAVRLIEAPGKIVGGEILFKGRGDPAHGQPSPERIVENYPFELSGGMRQSVMIAMMVSTNPELLIADEPTSALDVSVQAQILNLLKDLQKEHELTYLFITHDLSVVRFISTKAAVMYLGKIVEMAPTEELFNNALHPYACLLLDAVPVADPGLRREKQLMEGDVPTPIDPPSGCRFRTRCRFSEQVCSET